MPGELGNCIAGRVANLFNLRGPNFIVDAACASALAAWTPRSRGLSSTSSTRVTGGVDRNMGASTFVKFCKIGALSATGTRPFDEGADGFVMGEGAALFVLKRLADAERDGDRIYAVIRGIGGASDGRGKGITAPNPVGQRLAVERAWRNAGLSPATCSLIEAHGTSTRVGDVVEVEASPTSSPVPTWLPARSRSARSSRTSATSRRRPARPGCSRRPSPCTRRCSRPASTSSTRTRTRLDASPFAGQHRAAGLGGRRRTAYARAGVSAFGFGGTNFHVVLEEYVPGRLTATVTRRWRSPRIRRGGGPHRHRRRERRRRRRAGARRRCAVRSCSGADTERRWRPSCGTRRRGGAPGRALPAAPPTPALRAARARRHRLRRRCRAGRQDEPALQALRTGRRPRRGRRCRPWRSSAAAARPARWRSSTRARDRSTRTCWPTLPPDRAARAGHLRGGRRGDGPAARAASPDRRHLRRSRPTPAAVAKAEEELRQTEITQPAVLAVDLALTRLLAAYGIAPDMVMGHSLGEYGALVAAGALQLRSRARSGQRARAGDGEL